MNSQDDDDMLKQMRTLYIKSNKLLRTFHYCTLDVKLELFRRFCVSLYCCYLWRAKNKHFISYVWHLIPYTVVFLVNNGDATPVQCTCMLILTLIKH